MVQLYVGSNGTVAALDVSSGDEVWRTKLDAGGGFFSSTAQQDVTIIDHDGKVFAGSNGNVFCLDANSGAILWHNGLKGLGYDDISLAIAGKSTQVLTRTETKD